MKRPLGAVVFVVIAALVISTDIASAGPFHDFVTTIRRAIAQPKETPRPHRRRHKHNETPSSDGVSNQQSGAPVPLPAGQPDVRWAKAASDTRQHANVPYGMPVPGKPGFVTSPFAPERGYVDVTGFPTGTAVEDPYSGKIFLTP